MAMWAFSYSPVWGGEEGVIASEISCSVLGMRRDAGLSRTRVITPEGTRLYSM